MKRLLPYISLTLAFLAVAFAVNAAVSQGVRKATGAIGSATPQAWFASPVSADSGLYAHRTIDVSIRFGSSRVLHWEVVDAGRMLASGTVVRTPTGTASLRISTARASYHTWFLIFVSGIRFPLQAWVI